ncbi:MAG: NAD(+)/NADH kinase [Anaerolineae bacterium]
MKRIGLLFHPMIEESQELARKLADTLEGLKVSAWVVSAWKEDEIRQRAGDLDLLITLGGDGTILRAARAGVPHAVPILSVNFGRLGFLAECNPDEVEGILPDLLAGHFWLEERMMLHAEHRRGGEKIGIYEALNDVVVSRGALPRLLRLEMSVDGVPTMTYFADGLIVATPTASTAYSLAAGGPVVAPELRTILVTPIAAHLTTIQSMVLPSKAEVTICPHTNHSGLLTIDGQIDVEVQDSDQISVTASEHICRFVRRQSASYFYRTLGERLR